MRNIYDVVIHSDTNPRTVYPSIQSDELIISNFKKNEIFSIFLKCLSHRKYKDVISHIYISHNKYLYILCTIYIHFNVYYHLFVIIILYVINIVAILSIWYFKYK